MAEDDPIRDYHDTPSVVGEVSCALNESEAEERADWVETELLPHLTTAEAIEDGYVLVFPKTDAALEAVVTAVVLESRCCSDNSFTLEVPADGDEIRLALTGPPGTKELARQGFFEMFEAAPEPP